MDEEKIYYQPTVEEFKYDWLRGKWIHKELHASTLIFVDWLSAENYKYKFISGLKEIGVKLKDGNFKYSNAKVVVCQKN